MLRETSDFFNRKQDTLYLSESKHIILTLNIGIYDTSTH